MMYPVECSIRLYGVQMEYDEGVGSPDGHASLVCEVQYVTLQQFCTIASIIMKRPYAIVIKNCTLEVKVLCPSGNF